MVNFSYTAQAAGNHKQFHIKTDTVSTHLPSATIHPRHGMKSLPLWHTRISQFHFRYQPKKEPSSSGDLEIRPMTLTEKLYPDWVKMNQCAKYLHQR